MSGNSPTITNVISQHSQNAIAKDTAKVTICDADVEALSPVRALTIMQSVASC